MTEVFVIRNQLGHYWGKSKAWVDGSEAKAVLRVKHEDEAINTLFELSSKDIELRGEVIRAELSERGEPMVEASQIPLIVEDEESQPDVVVAETAVEEKAEETSAAQAENDGAAAGDLQAR